jgi:hypothetical protein
MAKRADASGQMKPKQPHGPPTTLGNMRALGVHQRRRAHQID